MLHVIFRSAFSTSQKQSYQRTNYANFVVSIRKNFIALKLQTIVRWISRVLEGVTGGGRREGTISRKEWFTIANHPFWLPL